MYDQNFDCISINKINIIKTLMKEGAISVIKYRLVVGGIGVVYEGDSVSEAKRQFRLFLAKSQTAGSKYSGEPVTLFKNYDIIREYRPPDA